MTQQGAVRRAGRWLGDGRWRRLATAIAAGAAMTAGQPPVSVPWLVFAALPVLVWLVDAAPGLRAAALVGWGAGFGYFVAGLYWIGYAFLVDPDQFLWLMPFAVMLLPAFLGLFWAAAFALARRIWPVGGAWRALVLAACLTLAEYLRGHALTGFPWGLPGYVWVETPAMQAAAWAGPFGMTLLTLALPALLVLGLVERRWPVAAAAAVALAGLWVAGAERLADTPAADGPVLRVVQPNADQKLKWLPDFAPVFYRRLIDATTAPPDPALGPPAAVIWPETAVPFLPAQEPEARVEIAAAAGGAPVLTGAVARSIEDGAKHWYNTLTTILPGGALGPVYRKHHLVPFGEYLPYPALLEPLGLKALVPQAGFDPGPGPQRLDVPGLPPFSPLICYEMIFPDEVVPPGPRPGWLLQLTNDGWFGDWGGPQQHLAQARIRAIEQGLPVVRAANTGISAAIDAHGRVVASIPMLTEGHIDFRLPAALASTPYAQTGDWPAVALSLAVVIFCTRRRRAAA